MVVAVMAYPIVETSVIWVPSETGQITDSFGFRFDEQTIVRRPFAQPSMALGTFGVIVLLAGVAPIAQLLWNQMNKSRKVEGERVKCQCGFEYEGRTLPQRCPQCGKPLRETEH